MQQATESQVPASIVTPDRVQTGLRRLVFTDGAPTRPERVPSPLCSIEPTLTRPRRAPRRAGITACAATTRAIATTATRDVPPAVQLHSKAGDASVSVGAEVRRKSALPGRQSSGTVAQWLDSRRPGRQLHAREKGSVMARNRVRAQPGVAAGLVMAALLLAPIAQAQGAAAPRVVSIRDAAGASPFAGLTCSVQNPNMQTGGREGEPHIAVNPRNPANRIAAWMDRTRSTVNTAYTNDGGLSWHKSIPLGLDDCTGSAQETEGNADIWISFSPDGGSAYLTSIP
jgi:hypothetical protein